MGGDVIRCIVERNLWLRCGIGPAGPEQAHLGIREEEVLGIEKP